MTPDSLIIIDHDKSLFHEVQSEYCNIISNDIRDR